MKFVIINRSFWPESDVVGEGLLNIAELASNNNHDVYVICQSGKNIKNHLIDSHRGSKIKNVYAMNAFTDSSSSIILRIVELLFFSIWSLFFLIKIRPKKIYISTDPPILLPFVISQISRIFSSKIYYHIQDIHPEATNISFKLNNFFYSFLKKIDNLTINRAYKLITISNEMKNYILERNKKNIKIDVIKNCAIKNKNKLLNIEKQKNSIIYCGNLGRLQRIQLLIDSIKKYISNGGGLEFVFIGGGVFSQKIHELSVKYPQVKYIGKTSSLDASIEMQKHDWGILSIEDEVTKYAYPSKISSYILNDCKIFAICGKSTNISRFIESNHAGIVSEPEINNIVQSLFKIEQQKMELNSMTADYKEEVTVEHFAKQCLTSMGLD